MIKNVIFDLGNVVLKLKWNIVIDRYTKDPESKKLLTEVIFVVVGVTLTFFTIRPP